METLAEYNATIVALTPQLAEHSRAMIEKNTLSFDLLSDPGNAVADTLGLRFTLSEEMREIYMSIGLNLPVHNGEDSWTMPVPARLVIDSGGIVRAADVDPDYTQRPEATKTVYDVAALS